MILLDLKRARDRDLSISRSYAPERARARARRAYAWIKRCSTSPSTAVPFRRRFTLRGDSLWWFAGSISTRKHAILPTRCGRWPLRRAVERDRPLAVRMSRDGIPASWHRRGGAEGGATADGIPRDRPSGTWRHRPSAPERSPPRALSRLRSAQAAPPARAFSAGSSHRFGKSDGADGIAESYSDRSARDRESGVGRAPPSATSGSGAATIFRARRWWSSGRPARRGGRPASSATAGDSLRLAEFRSPRSAPAAVASERSRHCP